MYSEIKLYIYITGSVVMRVFAYRTNVKLCLHKTN